MRDSMCEDSICRSLLAHFRKGLCCISWSVDIVYRCGRHAIYRDSCITAKVAPFRGICGTSLPSDGCCMLIVMRRVVETDASITALADHDPSYKCVCRSSEVNGAGLTQCYCATCCDKRSPAALVTHVQCDVVDRSKLVSHTFCLTTSRRS